MEYVLGFFAIGAVALLGAISPGPDFAIVTKNALVGSRRAGIATALGVATGCLVHVTYSIVGIGAIVASSVLLFTTIKWLGALYLLYLGMRMLFSKHTPVALETDTAVRTNKSFGSAFREGLLANVLNPKATLFFLAVFTQVISIDTSIALKAAYGIEVAAIAGLWFCALSLFLNIGAFKTALARSMRRVEQAMGAVLVALACSVALDHR